MENVFFKGEKNKVDGKKVESMYCLLIEVMRFEQANRIHVGLSPHSLKE